MALVVNLVLLVAAEGVARLLTGAPPHRSVFESWGDGVGEASFASLFAGVVGVSGTPRPPERDRTTPWFLPADEGPRKGWRRNGTKLPHREVDDGRIDVPALRPRLFALGGSTTWGIPGAENQAFSDGLARGLGTAWEVVNVAGPGLDSEDIRAIVDETAAMQPSAYVFYEGHNDCGNAMFHRRYLSTVSPRWMRADVLLWNSSRLYSLLRENLEPWRRWLETRKAREADTAAVIRLRRDVAEHQRAMVAARFRENLEHMVDVAQGVGARFVVVVPVSEMHMRPRTSFRYEVLDAAASARFDQVLVDARLGRADLDLLRETAALDPRHAELAWHLGQAELAAGNLEDGRRWLRQARDWDGVTNRATQQVVDEVRAVAARGLPMVDGEQVLAGADGLPAADWFVDEVHLDAAAHARLAEAILPLLRTE